MCRHTGGPKKRDFSYRQRKGEKASSKEEYFFFTKTEREKREKSLNFFFFSDRANGLKEGGELFWCVFLEKRERKDEFYRFLERDISRGTSSSSSNITSPARALRITTHE